MRQHTHDKTVLAKNPKKENEIEQKKIRRMLNCSDLTTKLEDTEKITKITVL